MKYVLAVLFTLSLSIVSACNWLVYVSSQKPNCHGGFGKVLLTKVEGGVRPYTYSWSNGAKSQNLIARPGTYSLVITDSLGCTFNVTATIEDVPALVLTTKFTDITKPGGLSTVTNTTTDGKAPYKYIFLDNQNKPFVPKSNKVKAGAFRVRVIDSKGCTMETVGFHIVKDYVEPIKPTVARISKKDSITPKLGQNYPNPFNKTTVIEYVIPKDAESHIELRYIGYEYNKTFKLDPEEGKIEIEKDHMPAGPYNYILFVNGKAVDSKKLVIQ